MCDFGITMSKSKHHIVFLSLSLAAMNINYDRIKRQQQKTI
jgi:hypothetical protein